MQKVTENDSKVRELATQLGETPKHVAAYINQAAYREEYNAREDVQAKRKEYNARRASEMKKIRHALAQDPTLRAKLNLDTEEGEHDVMSTETSEKY